MRHDPVAASPSFGRAAATAVCLSVAACPALAEEPCVRTVTVEASPDPEGVDLTRLQDVVVVAPDDIWAVGYSRSCTDCGSNPQTRSVAMHYDGSSWSIVPTPSPLNPNGDAIVYVWSVDALGPDAVYAAGHCNDAMILTPDTFLMRWDGSEWDRIATPGVSAFGAQGFILEAVRAIDDENIWLGGQFPGVDFGVTDPVPVMIRYDGSDFHVQDLPRDPLLVAAYRVRAVDATSPNDVWAAGSAGGSGLAIGRSYVARYDGSSWTRVPTPQLGFGEILWAVAAVAPDDVWVSGRYQVAPPKGGPVQTRPLFLHWDGADWTAHEAPGFATDLLAFAPDDIYGVGGPGILHWDGTAWTEVAAVPAPPPGTTAGVSAIDAVADCSLVAVGATVQSVTDASTLVVRLEGPSDAPGDLDGDGVVGTSDLLIVLAAWGGCDGCPEDLDGDGIVGTADLLAVLAGWTGS